ncbi:uncharacterized protein LOC132631339 [Lycium barbarum]|uniref:uncharacterized protein LOC132631339 n=1 Tax=Lycium barbarum TaxID=112863 RepID=UPI00293F23E7|nr:uncharacterized protein LOC132631339 [Lycium barbarum]
MHNRLQTRSRLAKIGVCQEDSCLLCGCYPETREHLFFQCTYSQTCLKDIMEWLQIKVINWEKEGTWRRLARQAKGSVSRSFVWAVLAAAIYYIWMARIDAFWNMKVPHPRSILKKVMIDSKHRILEVLNRKRTCKDRRWIEDILSRINV